MAILKVILGILMILSASTVLALPALSSIVMCWFFSFSMLITGIVTIIRYIEAKNREKIAEKNGKSYIKTGIGSLLFGIAAVVVSLLANSSIIGELVLVRTVSVMFGTWIVLDGISNIACAVQLKKMAVSGWVALLITGILLCLAGVFCIVDCFTSLTAMGTMYGISMIMAGFALIFS